MADFDLKAIEERWQEWWSQRDSLRFDTGDQTRPIYSFDVPPPYASGALHAGHAVHYTHQDFMARFQRMRGNNVFFPLCFDVNGIPIEERVERERGITRKDIGRQEFIEICSRFADGNIESMKKQFLRLGHSLDETIFYRTDAESYRRITQLTFLRLLEAGRVYRGEFPVNWCPRCMTAMADAEVEHAAGSAVLNYVRFPESGGDDHVLIATTRPELIATCQVVAVHPDDESKKSWVGRKLTTPIFGKTVDVIADDSVDMSFGTGALMVCSIGDKDDLQKILKYGLPMEIVIEGDGTLNELAGAYAGMTIKDARAKIIEDLKSAGSIEKQEPTEQNVGVCWRCKTTVEYIQNPQWFLKIMDSKEAILDASDSMDWFPDHMRVRLKNWTDSLQWDWVISRQRYFATPIPVWLCQEEDCDGVVAAKPEQCYVDPTRDAPPGDGKCPECGKGSLKGSDDVFDTWMDSSISPLYNAGWQRDEALFKRLYPMTVRPQSHDIIRTWLFYTIVRCLQVTEQRPFKKVMMGGFILAPDGGPMHKSRGNVIDPLEIIETHGAEPLRYYAATCSLGEDNAVRFQDFVRGERFARKFHNIQNFIGGTLAKVDGISASVEILRDVDHWILGRLAETIDAATRLMDDYAYAAAMQRIESFAWHDVADHYLEIVKARAYDADPAALWTLRQVGLGLTKMLAPLFPHVTEDAFQQHYRSADPADSIHESAWPEAPEFDVDAGARGKTVTEIVAAVRSHKSASRVALNAPVQKVEILADSDAAAIEANATDIKAALQVQQMSVSADAGRLKRTVVAVRPVHATIGPAFRGDAKAIAAYLSETPAAEIAAGLGRGKIDVRLPNGKDVTLGPEHVEVVEGYSLDAQAVDVLHVGRLTVTVSL